MKPNFDPVSIFLTSLCVFLLIVCILHNLSFFAQMARDIPALLTGAW